LPAVKRLHLAVVLIAVLALLPAVTIAGGASAQEGGVDSANDRQPAVVIPDDEGGAEEAEAWTFRFLVPTVAAMSALALTVTVLWYGVRVRGRYRVAR
jgi:hypothetical protein